MTPIRVTDEQDGDLLNRGYAYWPQAWVNGDLIYVFVGHADGRPRFFSVHRQTGEVLRLGPLMPYTGTAEGWYWNAEGWIYLCDGPRLRRVNPFTGEDLVIFDISERHPGCDLWQAHSSDDGRVHSATVRRVVPDGAYQKIGTVVSRDGQEIFVPAIGTLDESHLTGHGEWLLVEQDNNLLVRSLVTGEERWMADVDGALAHIDCGPNFAVGEADKPDPGRCDLVTFPSLLRVTLFHTTNMGHVSVRGGHCLLSDATHLSLVALDGSGVTPLLEHGMVIPPDTPDWKKYDYQVHGNLSPCRRVVMWMSNKEGRMDAYILKLPI